ncbi:carboxymuconolactone decarboxylase family protein [Conexibacter woesei]|uniref:carboxymuconolactone decarboxylase family protein n=1 Tax=Conexibacter woesei TaxID=191495 RepID=UPI0003F9305E|nr:carboxymuconolactone decarboxylase family protein [Conexibacter woesei]
MTNLPTHDSTPRAIDFPRAYKRLVALQGEINEGLDPHISHLVKLRASQVNGCAYCIDMHVDEALADGIDAKLLHLVATWHEVDLFSPREQAALALTEAVTLVSESHVPRAVWDQAAEHFGEAELGALLWQIIAINSWNRLAIATRAVPESLKPAAEPAGAAS